MGEILIEYSKCSATKYQVEKKMNLTQGQQREVDRVANEVEMEQYFKEIYPLGLMEDYSCC